MCNSLNIKINTNKTKIINLNKHFKYCKWYFKLINNKVILIPDKSTIYRQRIKLRKVYSKYLNKEINYNEINIVKACLIAHLNIGNSYKYIKYLNKRYNMI